LYTLTLSINGLPKTTNQGARRHWRYWQAESRLWQDKVLAHIGRDKPPLPLLKAKLILTRHSSFEPDFDGLVSSFKVIIDSLRHAQILFDDKQSNIGQPEYKWSKVGRNKGSITVEVFEI
jgi:Holliday junction resolvase RusA-like endonuclease